MFTIVHQQLSYVPISLYYLYSERFTKCTEVTCYSFELG